MESYGTLVDTVVEEEAVVVPIKKTSIKKGKGKPKPKEKGIAKGKGKARPKAKPVEEVVVPDGRPTKLTRPKKGSKGKIQPNLNVVALRFKAKPKPKVKNPADLFGRTAKRLSKRGWFRWGSDESEDTKPASGESDTLENDFEPVSVESELYSADEETNEFGDETDAEDDADAGVDLTSNFLEDTTDTSTSDSPISTAENASPPFAPPAPYQQTIEDLAAQGALLGPGWSWLEGTKDDARQRGVVVPAGWEWGGEWFEIARHLPREDAAYLENLPLTIWIEGIQSYAVHAGMREFKTSFVFGAPNLMMVFSLSTLGSIVCVSCVVPWSRSDALSPLLDILQNILSFLGNRFPSLVSPLAITSPRRTKLASLYSPQHARSSFSWKCLGAYFRNRWNAVAQRLESRNGEVRRPTGM